MKQTELMNQADITMKMFMNHNDISADIINNAIFMGMPVVKPEDLYYTNTETEFSGNRKFHNQYQDLSRFWIVSHKILARFSIENQMDVRNAEPCKLIGYDGSAYALQNTNDHGPQEKKTHYPCISIVLYYGRKHWSGKMTLHEMLQGDWAEYLKQFTPDYRMNVTEVCFLDAEDLRTYRSDFRIPADYLVQTQGKKPLDYVPNDLEIRHPEVLFPMMNVLSGLDWSGKAIDEMIREWRKITMVSAYAVVTEKARNEGIIQGINQGINQGISIGRSQMKSACVKAETRGRMETAVNMLKGGKLSDQDISAYSGLSMKEVEKLKKSLNC